MITPAEQRWIDEAQELMKRMPRSLFLFGCEGGLLVFHQHPTTVLPVKQGEGRAGEGIDSSQALATLTGRCDGGAW